MKEVQIDLQIPDRYNHFFSGPDEKLLMIKLIEYLALDIRPEVSPADWQNIEIIIRYLKRDVWHIEEHHRKNAEKSMFVYQIKYITDKLKRSEITEILREFFKREGQTRLIELFEQKFHATFSDLIFTQEQIRITKEDIKNLDKFFEYPAWIEFDDDALDLIFEKILNNEFSETQLQYILGASDDMKDYDKWYKVAKHILSTTNDASTFWLAGDVLNIVWLAAPDDEKSQKWFRDEIFEIFWPRIKNIWPMLNPDDMDFEKNDEVRIMADSIGWLKTLDDLRERLPELGDDYEIYDAPSEAEKFDDKVGEFKSKLESKEISAIELLDTFFELADLSYSEKTAKELEELSKGLITRVNKTNEDIDPVNALGKIKNAITHAENYATSRTRERENIKKLMEEENV